MLATPPLHVELAVAWKFTGEPTVLLFAGVETWTPDEPDTVMLMGVVVAPPQ
jgi:hypothetical protein